MSGARTEKVRKSYAVLCDMETNKKCLSIEEIARRVGWKPGAVKTHPSKKWKPFVTRLNNVIYVKGLVGNYSEDEYVNLMSQKNEVSSDPKKPQLPELVEQLLDKSRDAALLSVDVYNRPSSSFRTESFIVTMTIAWTALLHAIFENNGKNYCHYNDAGSPVVIDGDKKAWELSKCADEYFGATANAIKENIKFIIKLRNKIEHRFVPTLDMHVAGECQAFLLNFDNTVYEEFGDYWSIRDSLFVPLQTTRMRSKHSIETQKKVQAQNYDELTDFIDCYRDGLPDDIYQDPKFSFRVYLVPKTGNHESSSDIAFEFVKYDPDNPKDMDALEKQVTLIKEKQVQVANQGKYKPSHVVKEVNKLSTQRFTMNLHTKAWKKYKVRKQGTAHPEACKTKYCQFDEVHYDYVYTKEWIDFLVAKVRDDAEYKKLISYKE